MLSSLSSGVSGLDSFQQDMDVIGNNIANLNTTGFKAGVVDFADAFSNTLQGGRHQHARYIQVGTGVAIAGINSDWNQGAITSTGVSSDLAISGNGFFEVMNPTTQAVYATRDGTFSVNSSGQLVTSNGYIVQGYTDNSLSTLGNVTINITGSTSTAAVSSYTIDSQGQITVTQADGTAFVCGQVLLANVAAPQMLTNEGSNLYGNLAGANGGTAPTLAAPGGTTGVGNVQAGSLESSNVDLSTEMANLITAQQAFDASSKMISTSNEVLETVVNMKSN